MSATEVFFDTNIVVYFASENEAKAGVAERLLRAGGTISVQVLNEFVNVGLLKHRLTFSAVHTTLTAVRAVCRVEPLTIETHERALAICERYQLNVHDALIIAAAQLAGCRTLYSEDMHDGLTIDGLTIRNPFVAR